MTKKNAKRRNQKRQNQARRRPTMSSSRSCTLSVPNRLGHGISRWKSRSAKPRKTTTTPTVASSDTHQFQPFCCVNQTKSAGLVSTATIVAARVSVRQPRASSCEVSPWGSAVRGSAVAIRSVYACSRERMLTGC